MKKNLTLRMRLKQADLLYQSMQFEAACENYRKLSLIAPFEAAIWHRLSASYRALGQFEASLQALNRLIALEPNNGFARNEQGLLLVRLAQYEEAINAFTAALPLSPDPCVVHMNIGQTYLLLGDAERAIQAFDATLHINPRHIEAHVQRSTGLGHLGRPEEALSAAEQALRIRSDTLDAWICKGEALTALGQHEAALDSYTSALQLAPEHQPTQQRIVDLCRVVRCNDTDGLRYQTIIQHLYHWQQVDFQTVCRFSISFFKAQPGFCAALQQAIQDHQLDQGMASIQFLVESWPAFFTGLLTQSILEDSELEILLTDLRKRLLLFLHAHATHFSRTLPACLEQLLHALTLQCQLNEYVWQATDSEEQLVDTIIAQHNSSTGGETGRPDDHPLPLFMIALYRPLHLTVRLNPNAASFSKNGALFTDFLRRQYCEPVQEATIKSGIPSLTEIKDAVSRRVRAQYEESPYPRWLAMPLVDPKLKLQSLRAMLNDPADADYLAQPIEILVAGCGTGRQSIQSALNFPRAKITAIDLSLSSLAYAIRKTQEQGIQNIDYLQADIMALGNWDKRFHLIESAGVLHHLQNPVAGWHILCSLLAPGGLMRIALYSNIARKRLDVTLPIPDDWPAPTTLSEIKAFRQQVLNAQKGSALADLACSGPDFYSLSACRDLLFHVQEQRFTLPELQMALETLGLNFLGFELNPETIQAYARFNPSDPKGMDLQAWHHFEVENPLTFAGMYQFWCQKAMGGDS